MRRHNPLGPNGSYKTGQRVPMSGWYRNQYGQVVHFERASTFPPRVGRPGGGVAYWKTYKAAATA